MSAIFYTSSEITEKVSSRLPSDVQSFNLAVPYCTPAIYRLLKKHWQNLPAYPTLSPPVLKRLLADVSSHGIPPEFVLKYNSMVGWGLFVAPGQEIEPNKIIGIYSGRVLLVNPRTPRETARIQADESYNFLIDADPIRLTKDEFRDLSYEGSVKLDPGYSPSKGLELIVDASESGNFTRFVNHSENPNLQTCCRCAKFPEGWQVVVVLIAKRRIFENEPLSFDYGSGYWKGKGISPNELLSLEFT
ncbi:MAG: SET domain-containing protein-lysine N-methyltransferase [Verrucomicrobia bacterium]|nr:SET domain-containing protein-lysine N-methyltransferase [Verrucomicrobiota bacterium]